MMYRCLVLASVLPVAACTTDALGLGAGSGDTVVTPRLLRTDVPAARRVSRLAPDVPAGPFSSSDLRITSLRAPLMAIALEGDHHGMVYECAGATSDDCLIDLAAGNALVDLLQGEAVAVEPGTYTRVRMYTCKDVGYRAYLAAEVTLDGQTYVTDPTASSGLALADAEAVPGAVSVDYGGCAMHYDLPVPLTIAEGDALDLKLYFDMRSIAWASLGDAQTPNAWLPSGCTSTAGDAGPFACMGYPNVAATIDDAPPTVEHYRVNGVATFGMFFDSQDRFFGGYTRRTYVEGDAHVGVRGIGADTPLKRLEARDGGLFHVENYGSSADGPGYFASDDFQRVEPGESFAGSFVEAGSGSYPYTAQRLD